MSEATETVAGGGISVEQWLELADDVAREARMFTDVVDGLVNDPVGEAREAAVPLLLTALASVQSAGAVIGVISDAPLPDADAYDDWVEAETPASSSSTSYKRLLRALGAILDQADAYARLAHPYDSDPDDVVEVRLSDDIAEVYRALDDGLEAYDAGFRMHAVAQWQETYRVHWGHHAAGAVVALHALLAFGTDDDEDDDDEDDDE
jgi:hypothetical protein